VASLGCEPDQIPGAPYPYRYCHALRHSGTRQCGDELARLRIGLRRSRSSRRLPFAIIQPRRRARPAFLPFLLYLHPSLVARRSAPPIATVALTARSLSPVTLHPRPRPPVAVFLAPQLCALTTRSLGVPYPRLLSSPDFLPRPAMATSPADHPSTAAQSIPHSTTPADPPGTTHDALSSAPVEMRTLHTPTAAAPDTATTAAPTTEPTTAPTTATTSAQPTDTSHAAHVEPTAPHVSESTSAESTQPVVPTSAQPATRAELNRTETEAIGPSTDTPAANPDNSSGPTVVIMLLLTTGARHPYKIDEKYLKKRNVTVENMNPYNISVYTLKELIWRDWREGMLHTSTHSFAPFECPWTTLCVTWLFSRLLPQWASDCTNKRYQMIHHSAVLPNLAVPYLNTAPT
jgi:hypothetical protein